MTHYFIVKPSLNTPEKPQLADEIAKGKLVGYKASKARISTCPKVITTDGINAFVCDITNITERLVPARNGSGKLVKRCDVDFINPQPLNAQEVNLLGKVTWSSSNVRFLKL